MRLEPATFLSRVKHSTLGMHCLYRDFSDGNAISIEILVFGPLICVKMDQPNWIVSI